MEQNSYIFITLSKLSAKIKNKKSHYANSIQKSTDKGPIIVWVIIPLKDPYVTTKCKVLM